MNATLLDRKTGKILNRDFTSYEEMEKIIAALNKNLGLDLEIVASEENYDCFIGRA